MQFPFKTLVHLLMVQALFVMGSIVGAESNPDNSECLVLMPRDSSDLWLSGTSTLHRWECKAKEVQGALLTNISGDRLREKVTAYLNGEIPQAEDGSEMQVWLEVRPADLDCDNARMHRDLNRAVRADEYPEIKYWYTGIESAPTIVLGDSGPELKVEVSGDLFLAGETRKVAHTATIRLIEPAVVEVEGVLELDMRDFDIDPPTALLGLIRAHPELKVRYRFEVPLKDRSNGVESTVSVPR